MVPMWPEVSPAPVQIVAGVSPPLWQPPHGAVGLRPPHAATLSLMQHATRSCRALYHLQNKARGVAREGLTSLQPLRLLQARVRRP
jgi:hypothetical protein